MAGDPVGRGGFAEGGDFVLAAGDLGLGAAGVEGAARGDVHGAGGLAFEHRGPEGLLRVGQGHRGQQGLGVGVQALPGEDLPGGHLHQAAQVHDRHPVADMGDDAQVMGDEEIGEAVALLQLGEQIEDLGLDGDVQGARPARRRRSAGA